MLELPYFWRPATIECPHPHQAIHLWAAALDRLPAQLAYLQGMLSREEVSRAERFLGAEARKQFTIGRGLLRILLGRYLGMPPGQIRFVYGKHEKPALMPIDGQAPLFFNISHSEGYVLLAFTGRGEVGVDLESNSRQPDVERIVPIVLTPGEQRQLKSLPPEAQRAAFYQFWVRKEAFIKMLGMGMTAPLRQLEVLHTPDQPVAELDENGAHIRWTGIHVQDIPFLPGFTAAVASEGPDWHLHCFSGLDPDAFNTWSGLNTQ